ncbi:MAG: Glycosyl transferase group 1 [Candidatus Yanofskybacteria bacterium GW2011_GWF1_44_227]|nr:MAG: Glycosyl transferase group 1 [Candidatus Yanofskybacteria bacterium GW2011_GWF1_44_227]
MISGVGASALAEGKRGAFYNTLEEFHKHWDRIDIICPRVRNDRGLLAPAAAGKGALRYENKFFGNVFIHPSPWPKILQPFWIYFEGLKILSANGGLLGGKDRHWELENQNWVMTVHEYPPFYNGLGARMLWNKIKVPYVLEIMHIPGYPRTSDLREFFYKFLTRIFISIDSSKAKAIRVINKNEVPGFLKKAGVSESKIKYIPAFYIDLDIFKLMNLEKKYDLIFVGRLEKNKGLDILLEIAKKSNLKILIVGNGALHNYLKLEIQNSKLNVGIVPDVLNSNNGRIIDWSSDQAIKAFKEAKDIKVETDLSRFDKTVAIKNYADNIKSLI